MATPNLNATHTFNQLSQSGKRYMLELLACYHLHKKLVHNMLSNKKSVGDKQTTRLIMQTMHPYQTNAPKAELFKVNGLIKNMPISKNDNQQFNNFLKNLPDNYKYKLKKADQKMYLKGSPDSNRKIHKPNNSVSNNLTSELAKNQLQNQQNQNNRDYGLRSIQNAYGNSNPTPQNPNNTINISDMDIPQPNQNNRPPRDYNPNEFRNLSHHKPTSQVSQNNMQAPRSPRNTIVSNNAQSNIPRSQYNNIPNQNDLQPNESGYPYGNGFGSSDLTNPNDRQPTGFNPNNNKFNNRINHASHPYRHYASHHVSRKQRLNQETKQYRYNVHNGIQLYNHLDRPGKRYLRTSLRNLSWHNGLIDKIKNNDMKDIKPQEEKSLQSISDAAKGIQRSRNDGHIIGQNNPISTKDKALVNYYLKTAPKPVLKDNLIKHGLNLKQDEKKEIQYQRQNILSKEIKEQQNSGALGNNSSRYFNFYRNLSRPGQQYMKLNAEMASQDYYGFLNAKQKSQKLFNKYHAKGYNKIPSTQKNPIEQSFSKNLPWSMKNSFAQLNDMRGGFSNKFGRYMQVPKVPNKEARQINNIMLDDNNSAMLASGALTRPIKKYSYQYSDKHMNQVMQKSTPHLTQDQIEPARQFFLGLKPRTRRYMAAIARYSAKNFAATRRVIGQTPRNQLNAKERYMSEHLYQMSHGIKRVVGSNGHAHWQKTGTPLPYDERHAVREMFMNPKWQPYFNNGDVNKSIQLLQNGNHKHDNILSPKKNATTTNQDYKSLVNGQKLYEAFMKDDDYQGAQYLTRAVQDYALSPKSFERELRANYGSRPDLLSIKERNDWKTLQGVLTGQKPDEHGNMVQVGKPAPAEDKLLVDRFLLNPKNRNMLYSGKMQANLLNRKNLDQKYGIQKAPHMSNGNIGAQGSFRKGLMNFKTMGMKLRNISGDRHEYSRSRLGNARQMKLHDLRRDEPGMDR